MAFGTTKYIDFKFGSQYLSDHKGKIINEGEDLKFFNAPSFSNEFANTKFGNKTYYLGSTVENKELNYRVILIGVTLNEYKNFLGWLNLNVVDYLFLDYNEDWGYKVKVSSISEGTFTVNPNCGSNLTYNVEVELGFITVNHWAAKYFGVIIAWDANGSVSRNYDNFVTISIPAGGVGTFVNNTNVDLFLDIVVITTGVFKLEEKGVGDPTYTTIYDLNYNGTFTVFSEYGIILNSLNEFVPTIINTGQYKILAKSTRMLKFTNAGSGSILVTPIIRDII